MSTIIEQPRYSCALAAQQTVLAIPKGIPIIHAGPGCSSKVFGFSSYGAGFQGDGYAGGANISCTNASEQEVVFGGEDKLRNTIDGALQVLNGDLYVVLTGCTSDIVGDDSLSVAKSFAREGKPVVGAETAGFKGNTYFGHELVVNEIIQQFVGDASPEIRKGLVNVFSVVPFQDPYWRGDLEAIKSLLEKIGLEVNILFGHGSRGVEEWKDIPNAEFNLLISPWVGFQTVKLLKEKYDTPYFHYPVLPIGAKETGNFLREVARFAGLDEKKTEAVIQNEEKRYYRYFTGLADFFSEFRNNLPTELYTVGDSLYAIAATNYLVNELGLIAKGVYIIDDPETPLQEGLKNIFESRVKEYENILVIEADGGKIEADIKEKIGSSKKAILLGSSWEKAIADETSNLYAFLSLPLNETVILHKSYTGYDGGLRLVEDIYSGLFNRKYTVSRTQLFV